jgi:hypothetical protein
MHLIYCLLNLNYILERNFGVLLLDIEDFGCIGFCMLFFIVWNTILDMNL